MEVSCDNVGGSVKYVHVDVCWYRQFYYAFLLFNAKNQSFFTPPTYVHTIPLFLVGAVRYLSELKILLMVIMKNRDRLCGKVVVVVDSSS